MSINPRVIVFISANAEWRAVKANLAAKPLSESITLQPTPETSQTPYGETLLLKVGNESVMLMQGGWGKISAAASTQYAIDTWHPQLLINLGTCGGFAGAVDRQAILLVERTLVYDIVEQMGDSQAAIDFYATHLDTSWWADPLPGDVQRSLLVSADRDLIPSEIGTLRQTYQAIAGDWESGAIAWVADKNKLPCIILRGVTDLVGEYSGEAYGDFHLFEQRTEKIMQRLFELLPLVLKNYFKR